MTTTQTLFDGISSLKVSDSTKAILLAICTNETELEYFLVECWSGDWEDQFEAIQQFRLWKQKSIAMSKQDFVIKASTNALEALETLCQYPVSIGDFEMIKKLMKKRNITWADMFDKHMKRPTYLPLSMVL